MISFCKERQKQGWGTERTDLVATDLLRYVIQCLYYSQTELLPLLVFVNHNIFDMADETKVVYARLKEHVSPQTSSWPR